MRSCDTHARQSKSSVGGVALGRLNGYRMRRISLDPKAKQSDTIECDCPYIALVHAPEEQQPR